jgi:hypothetical protein
MTKQEVEQELKETEGDPIIKGRIRRIQREMARKRMMTDVRNSNVVITKPARYDAILQDEFHGCTDACRQGCRIFGTQDMGVGTGTRHALGGEQAAGQDSP